MGFSGYFCASSMIKSYDGIPVSLVSMRIGTTASIFEQQQLLDTSKMDIQMMALVQKLFACIDSGRNQMKQELYSKEAKLKSLAALKYKESIVSIKALAILGTS